MKTIKVIFRIDTTKEFKGEVIAVFPYEVERNGNITIYVHNGQHSSGDYNTILNTSRLALPSESESLRHELVSIGYNLQVINRRNYSKYLRAYKNNNK